MRTLKVSLAAAAAAALAAACSDEGIFATADGDATSGEAQVEDFRSGDLNIVEGRFDGGDAAPASDDEASSAD